tara:strand:- start:255 stop:518 length:264 start_codon:yes stop_codon:yes gene_type:complete
MENRRIYAILLIILYLLYITFHKNNIVKQLFNINETFEDDTDKTINDIKNAIKILNRNIVDLAVVSKHNSTNICKFNKTLTSAEYRI